MKTRSTTIAGGPLRVHPGNPRYFADGSGRAVYLTGAHTWNNLVDMGIDQPPQPFNWDEYLDFLERHHHNFVRLWTWVLTATQYHRKVIHAQPQPWARTGPGLALDGLPKFDLTRWDDAYFARLRQRVESAQRRGIYVSVMLFEGHALHASKAPWCWDGHPFNAKNNINGIDGDPDGDGRGVEILQLAVPAIVTLQEAYVRHVADAVNDLDNVLYEICNEAADYSTAWQYHMIRLVHDYERTKAKQHPVGMTFQYAADPYRGSNATLLASPADWISPNPNGGYQDNPPAADGSKVILADTDHLWGIGGNQAWVWKSFSRGLNPLFMDPYYNAFNEKEDQPAPEFQLAVIPPMDAQWDPVRKNLGYTLQYADRMNLAAAVPHGELASTGYCLAAPGREYLVYLPDGGAAMVDLSAVQGKVMVEWLNPSTNERPRRRVVRGGTKKGFVAPFGGDAVLYLRATS
jgi:hypothetical protein